MDEDLKSILIAILCIVIMGVGIGLYVYFSFTYTSKKDKEEISTTVKVEEKNYYQFGDNQFQLLVDNDNNNYEINNFKLSENYNENNKLYELVINNSIIASNDTAITIIYIINDVLVVQLNEYEIGLFNNKGKKIDSYKTKNDFRIINYTIEDDIFKVSLTRVNKNIIKIDSIEYDICLTDFSNMLNLETDIIEEFKVQNNKCFIDDDFEIKRKLEYYKSGNYSYCQ